MRTLIAVCIASALNLALSLVIDDIAILIATGIFFGGISVWLTSPG